MFQQTQDEAFAQQLQAELFNEEADQFLLQPTNAQRKVNAGGERGTMKGESSCPMKVTAVQDEKFAHQLQAQFDKEASRDETFAHQLQAQFDEETTQDEAFARQLQAQFEEETPQAADTCHMGHGKRKPTSSFGGPSLLQKKQRNETIPRGIMMNPRLAPSVSRNVKVLCDQQGKLPPAVLIKNVHGDYGAGLLNSILQSMPGGSAADIRQGRGLPAQGAACSSGVALIGMNHLMRNNFTETYNSRGIGGFSGDEHVEQSLKGSCFDDPLQNYGLACSDHNLYRGQAKTLVSMLQKMDHGQVIVNSYAPSHGFFGNHIDNGTYGVVLWSFGTTATFAVCFSNQCQRHHSKGKSSCPHCHEFAFESGDCLIFNGAEHARCCHGVVHVSDKIAGNGAAKLPAWIQHQRVSLQWRGRREDSGGESFMRQGMELMKGAW